MLIEFSFQLKHGRRLLRGVFGLKYFPCKCRIPAWVFLRLASVHNLEWYPSIFRSSINTEYQIDDILHLGANGFFSKPFNATAVRESLTQTLLSASDRWARPTKRFGAQPIVKRLGSLKKAMLEKDFNFGQTGFYIHLEHDRPNVGDPVDFDIEFQDGVPFRKFEGSGHVAWVRHQQEGEFRPGIGVQIDYLDEFTIKKFIEWVENEKPIPSIPKD